MVTWKLFEGDADEWDRHLLKLDGTFYQTFEWGEVKRISGWEPFRLIAISEGSVIGLVSALVKKNFFFVICWVPDCSNSAIRLVDNKFHKALSLIIGSSFIYCRISFLSYEVGHEAFSLLQSGWKRPKELMNSGLTMHYELRGDNDQRIKRASGNWRHNLRRSSRFNLRIDKWKKPDINLISRMYREMELLKGLPVQYSLVELQAIISCLGDKVVVFRCLYSDNNLLAIRAAGVFGESALDLLAASGSAARKLYATHATLWALFDWCQENGYKYYDLSGVDPIRNKGVYDFKHGTGASLVECLGEWEWASIPCMCLFFNYILSRKK